MRVNTSETIQEILERVPQQAILEYYFGITSLPTLINSPLRTDRHPSFSIYSPDGVKVKYIDYATGEHGDIYNLLQQYFSLSFTDVVKKIGNDSHFKTCVSKLGLLTTSSYTRKKNNSDIKVKIREWQQHDIEYWEEYGISLAWLKYAEVYPISHKIIYKNGERYVFPAAKYAYCFVERKEDKVTLKVYQPFNSQYKWSNKNDGSVVGLWTKVPQSGDKLVICSSLKDALCLWANTGIPCIYMQSETTKMSDTAHSILTSRYKHVFVCFDNDDAGLKDAESFSASTGFTNVVLPQFEGGKDVSDFYKMYGRNKFLNVIKPLFDE